MPTTCWSDAIGKVKHLPSISDKLQTWRGDGVNTKKRALLKERFDSDYQKFTYTCLRAQGETFSG
ncbi:MAG TPA: hypothetical protein DCG58_14905 [Hyphomonas adhaerens]|uniref:Uncharacterized protein n=1 Tax=Hyphomonas adhaerens TaxID=81029 RepID=A0A3B9H192_9PROT|nr:hypothetical protein [Hyphomonas adhaerens]